MDLYEYGRIVTQTQYKLNKLMYEYHHNLIDMVDTEKQAYEVVKKMEKEIYDFEHYQKPLKFTKGMIGE